MAPHSFDSKLMNMPNAINTGSKVAIAIVSYIQFQVDLHMEALLII